jgi:hypothetical protein
MQKKSRLPIRREVARLGCMMSKDRRGIGMPMRKVLLMPNEIFRALPPANNPVKRKPSELL